MVARLGADPIRGEEIGEKMKMTRKRVIVIGHEKMKDTLNKYPIPFH